MDLASWFLKLDHLWSMFFAMSRIGSLERKSKGSVVDVISHFPSSMKGEAITRPAAGELGTAWGKDCFSRLDLATCMPSMKTTTLIISLKEIESRCAPTGHTSHHHSHHRLGLAMERYPHCLGHSILLPAGPQILHEIALVND